MRTAKYPAALSLLLLFLLAALPATAVPSDAETGLTRVILTVDKGRFDRGRLAAMGGAVVAELELIPVVIADVPKGAIRALSHVPGVVRVELDGVVYALVGRPVSQPPQTIPWGVERIKAPDAWITSTGWADVNEDGDSEVEVAIIDTGIDTDHPDLADNLAWCITTLNGRVRNGCDDRNGHGTHVAGTVAAVYNDIGVVGVAHSVEIYAIRALNPGGLGSWSDLVLAIEVALKGPDGVLDADGDGVIVGDPEDDAPEVISMSLGGSSPPEALHDIIVTAYNYGVVIVAAAGNEGADYPSYPAAYPEVIAVGATDETDGVPSWSNRNPEVAAPGVNILSTYPDDTYKELSGTSMACPHVSGVVALIQASRLVNGLDLLPPGTETDATTDTVRGILHTTADDVGDPGYDSLYGYGIVRADLAVQAAVQG